MGCSTRGSSAGRKGLGHPKREGEGGEGVGRGGLM